MIKYEQKNGLHIASLIGFINAADFHSLVVKLEDAMKDGPIDFVEILRIRMMTPLTLMLDAYFFIKNRNRFNSITVVCDSKFLTALSKKISRPIFPFDVQYMTEKEWEESGH
jgi:hypothetical protein